VRALPKHLRPRWRYFGVEIETRPDARIDRRAFQAALWDAARGLLGDPGSADCNLTVVRFRFDRETGGMGTAIVRVRRKEISRGRAALACVRAVDGQPVGLAVRGTSGTIRACADKHCRDHRGRSDTPSGPGAEQSVRFPAADGSTTDRPAVGKPGGRVDVRTDEGFVGATILDLGPDSDSKFDLDSESSSDPDGG
jgi:ribonuclease P/MRP protein subunit POP5